MAGGARESDGSEQCEGCGDTNFPLRSIRMWNNEHESLCESCFIDALEDDRVHREDPRLVSQR